MFGAPASCVRVVRGMRRPHRHGTTPARRAFGRDHIQHRITPSITGLHLHHAHRGARFPQQASRTTGVRTTPCTTGKQHHGRSYHILHHGRRHDGAGTTGVQEAQFAASTAKRACQSRAPDAERFGVQPPRARPKNSVKKRTILRAKRSAGTACSALRHPAFGLPAACADHSGRVPRRHNGPSSVPRVFGITRCTTGVERNHVQHMIRLPRTGAPHTGPAYHVQHTTQSAQRACVPHVAQRAPARRSEHNARSGGPIRLNQAEKECQLPCHGRRTISHQPRPTKCGRHARPGKPEQATECQNRPDRGRRLHGGVGLHVSFMPC